MHRHLNDVTGINHDFGSDVHTAGRSGSRPQAGNAGGCWLITFTPALFEEAKFDGELID